MTKRIQNLIDRLASVGWDVISHSERLALGKEPRKLVHIERDDEAEDGRWIARLTDAGAEEYKQRTGIQLTRDSDESWYWS